MSAQVCSEEATFITPAAADRWREAPAVPGLTPAQQRLCDQIPDEVRYIHHESVETRLALAKKIRLTPDQERTLFLRYNYCRCRLHRLVERPGARSDAARVAEMVAWYTRSLAVRSNLVRANMGLAYAMSKLASSVAEFNERVSEASMALLRCVENFDVSHGARFSTYACRSILKGLGRMAKRLQRRRKNLSVQFAMDLDFADTRVDSHDLRFGRLAYEFNREVQGTGT